MPYKTHFKIDVDHLLPVVDPELPSRGEMGATQPALLTENVELAVSLHCQPDEAGNVLLSLDVRTRR